MSSVYVNRLTFAFPAGWSVSKYDDWSYYRNQFGKMRGGIKAVDLIAFEAGNTAWFIEAKDYRNSKRTKPSDLAEDVAQKVYDTLAAMLPAALNANDSAEQTFAADVCRVAGMRVVLHLEQPRKNSTLRPRAIDPAAVKGRLKALLKPIDARPVVAESSRMGSLAWSVT